MSAHVVIWNTGSIIEEDGFFHLYRTLGAYKIAHVVRKSGYTAQVIDHFVQMSEEDLYRCTRRFVDQHTVVLGISTTFAFGNDTARLTESAANTINKLLEEFPNLKIVFGGYNVNKLKNERPLKTKNIYAVIHYGEDIFVELIKHFQGLGPSPIGTMEFYQDQRMTIFSKPLEEKYHIELDDFQFIQQDCIMPNETLPIEISRGCIFKCKFCNHLMLGRAKLDYLRDFELVKADMLNNYHNWGTTNYYIICDTFNDTEIKMQAWKKMLDSLPFKIKYTAYLRADLLDRYPDVPHLLRETGLLAGFHGIESLGPGSAVIGKGWSQKRAREYIPKLYHDIWKGQVYQTLSFIAGLPGDTHATLNDTADWFKSNDLYHMIMHSLGLRNNSMDRNPSEFDRNAAKYGYRFPNEDASIEWENDYWSHAQVRHFLKNDFNKQIGRHSAKYSSWSILQLMQYGVDASKFEKSNTWTPAMNRGIFRLFAQEYLKEYVEKLMAL